MYVGAERNDKVHIFTKSDNVWSRTDTIEDGSGGLSLANTNSYFGSSIDLSSDGNTMYVGATGHRTGNILKGAVYILTKNSSGEWVYEETNRARNRWVRIRNL